MPVEPQLNWGRLKALQSNTDLFGSANIRAALDDIAGILISFLTETGGSGEPALPENFLVVGGDNIATLSWDPGLNNVSYVIERAISGDPASVTEVATTTATGYVDTGLSANEYLYRIRGRSLTGALSEWTEWESVEVTTAASGTPTTPTTFAAGSPTETTIDLSWDALAAGTVSIRIERKRAGTSFATIVKTDGTSYKDTALLPGEEYTYRAYGVASDGTESVATAEVSETTAATDTNAPDTPGNLTATGALGSVRFEWDAVVDIESPPVTYDIQFATVSGGPYAGYVGLTKPKALVAGTSPDSIYGRVRAVDAVGNQSAWSAEADAAVIGGGVDPTILPPPKDISVQLLSASSVQVTWTDLDTTTSPGNLATEYVIYTSTGGNFGPWTQAASVGVGMEKETLTGLAVEKQYWLYMATLDVTGTEGAKSPVLSFDTADVSNNNGPVDPVDPTDPNGAFTGLTDEPGGASSVHIFLESTAEENRTRFVDGLRSNRSGQTAALSGGVFNNPAAHGQFEDGEFSEDESWREFLNVVKGGSFGSWPADTTVLGLDNINGTNAPRDARWNGPLKWFTRRYRVAGAYTNDADLGVDSLIIAEDLDSNGNIVTVDDRPYYSPYQEHGLYDNPYGPIVVQNTTIRNLGGQGIQLANRTYDGPAGSANNPPYAKSQLTLIDNVHIQDVGVDSSKGAFALTFFDVGSTDFPNTIIVRNSSIVERWPFYKKRNDFDLRDLDDAEALNGTGNFHRSNGGVVVTQYQYSENPEQPSSGGAAAPARDFPTDDHPVADLVFQNCYIDMTRPEKPMMSIEGVNNVIFENCAFRTSGDAGGSPPARIEFNQNRAEGAPDSRGTRPCGTVTFRNCISQNVSYKLRQSGPNSFATLDGHTPGITRVYNGDTGALTSEAAYNGSTDFYDVAGAINTIDPFAGLTLGSITPVWNVSGVTV